MKLLDLFENGFGVPPILNNLKPKMAKAAQEVYDDWDESDVTTYANGGICHLIADAIVDVLYSHNIDAVSFSCSVGENHVMVACQHDGMTYIIDIPPYVYETGGGYSWKKIEDVEFGPEDIDIEYTSEDFSSYAEDF